jgi:sodium-dependent dicarboxylate transporter 2/3/5
MDKSEKKESFGKKYGLILALIAMAIVYLFPTPVDLPTQGHRLIGILVFAVIIWMTEGVSYPVSAFVIVTFMAFALGMAPDPAKHGALLGTSKALQMGLSGFSTTAWALVAAAMFLSAGMMITGLDKRIALVVMSHVGVKSSRLVIGVIFVGFILSFFVPSTTARVSCMVPIVVGIIRAFGLEKGSTFAAVLMMAVAQADSLWNIGIKTAAAQNMVAIGFIQQVLGKDISWLEWFIAAAPYAAVMSVILYQLLIHVMPPEIKEMPGGKEALQKMLKEMGPVSVNEKKLLIISCLLLFFWVTEKKLHPFDTTTVTITGIMLMMLPRIGFMSWKDAVPHINWGTVALFGVGISLGTALLKSGAAIWLANHFVALFGMETMTSLVVIAILAFFLTVIHLGFASATGLASAMIPIVIAVLQSVKTPGIDVLGMTMILQYTICFGYILPVNAPQNMIAYSTGYITSKDFLKTGIPFTIISYCMILLFSATYWHWLGYVG